MVDKSGFSCINPSRVTLNLSTHLLITSKKSMDNVQQQPQKSPNSAITWVILVVILIIAAVGIYLWWQNGETNTNTNTVVNTTNSTMNENVNGETNTNSAANGNTNTISNASNANSSANTNSVDISDWRTYTDPDSSLSVKYPSDWIVVDFDDLSAGQTFGFRPNNLQVGDESWSAVGVGIRSNPDMLDLETFYSQAVDFPNPYEASSSTDTIVRNGISMTYFEAIQGVIPISKLVFQKGSYVVEVWMGRDSSVDIIDDLEQIFFEVASSVE